MRISRGKGCLWGCGALAAIVFVVGFVGVLMIDPYLARRAAAPFAAMKDEARGICAQCTATGKQATAYRSGKVLFVDRETGAALGDVMQRLPAGVGAARPEEVGTIVCVGPVHKEQWGTYTDGSPAFRQHRAVCAYDVAARAVIYSNIVYGTAPPGAKSGSSSVTGSDPIYGILVETVCGWPVK